MKRLILPVSISAVLLAVIVWVLFQRGFISNGGSYDEDYADIVVTLEENRYDDAARLLKSFLRRYGEDPLALNNLAVIQVRQDSFDEADANFASAEKNAAGVLIPRVVTTTALMNRNGNLEIFHIAYSAAQGEAAYGDAPVETMELSGLIQSNIRSAGD